MYSTCAEENNRRASPLSSVPERNGNWRWGIIVDELTDGKLNSWLSRNAQGVIRVNEGVVS